MADPVDVVLLVMTDGREDCIRPTLVAAANALRGCRIVRTVIHDDSAAPGYREFLRDLCGPDAEILSVDRRLGFAGAIHRAWWYLSRSAEDDTGRFVFHLEDDFVLTKQLQLDRMGALLDARRSVMQIALRRQPVNELELAAGGVVEMWPEEYVDCSAADGAGTVIASWLEHRLFFTTNPSLYRRSLCARGWPIVPRSEGVFTSQLLEDPDTRFAYWGARGSGEWCSHIGAERIGRGY